MELTKRTAHASPAELAAIDEVLSDDRQDSATGDLIRSGTQRLIRRGPSRRTLLLPALNAIKDRVGWISQGALEELSERLLVPRAEIYGVATFYALLPTTPQPAKAVHVCVNMACRFAGGEDLLGQAQSELGGDAVDGDAVAVHPSPCLGQCEFAPAAFVECAGDVPRRVEVPEADTARIAAALNGSQPVGAPSSGPASTPVTESTSAPASASAPATDLRVYSLGKPNLVKRIVDGVAPSLADYRSNGGYEALNLATSRGPQWVLDELDAANLRGRGGAAFPTAVKWRAVAQAEATQRFVVANADESEPGTFKDKVLALGDPFALVEAMTIAAYVTGAQQGYIYVRSEYPEMIQILESACAQAEAAGLLGDNITLDGAGDCFSFHLELRRGAGAYICGEETALFNSIEGYRGEPRNKPPFPTESGLFSKPTLVNNVETFANILPILTRGGQAFAQIGTQDSSGTRLFCISGACDQPGVYEVPLGTSLLELLRFAQVHDTDEPLVLLGGAAGAFVGPDQLDVPLSFGGTAQAGLTLGSGAVIVVPPAADMADLLGNIAEFFVDESCGQCVPCRVGTVRQKESLGRLYASSAAPDGNRELNILADLDSVMTDASICGLGQTAASAIRSAIRLNLLDNKS